jgi:hypothetical protein
LTNNSYPLIYDSLNKDFIPPTIIFFAESINLKAISNFPLLIFKIIEYKSRSNRISVLPSKKLKLGFLLIISLYDMKSLSLNKSGRPKALPLSLNLWLPDV